MARLENLDGPDRIIGTNETDFIWVSFSDPTYYEFGINDNDTLDGAGGNTDIIMLSPGTDVIRDSEGWFGILEQPISLAMWNISEADVSDGVSGIRYSAVHPRAMVVDFEAGTYSTEWWGSRFGDEPIRLTTSSGTISGIRRVEGSEHSDTLRGSDFEIVFPNGSRRGEDFHLGGGADVVNGRGGLDMVLPGPVGFDDRIANFVVDLKKGTVQNLDGSISTVRNIEGAELTFDRDDVFIGDEANNLVRPNGGSNTINGGAGVDTVAYNASGGTLTAITARLNDGEIDNQYGGVDTVTKIEIVSATPLDDTLRGDGKANTFFGNNGNDVLLGLGGSDTLIGGFGEDNIMGNVGDDYLTGYGDNDTLRGDEDFDYADYSREFGSSPAIVNLDRGRATDTYSATDRLFDIEGAVGTGMADTMAGDDKGNHFLGGGEKDTLKGGRGKDTLEGELGDDSLLGEGGNDSLVGGKGKDILEGGSGDDELLGGKGKDTLKGGSDRDVLNGGDDGDVHEGGAGPDRIEANKGNDTYDGGTNGADAIVLDAAKGGITILMDRESMKGGGLGNNKILNVELVFGTDFPDLFRGDDSDNRLFGYNGKDKLFGGDGDDRLFGGVGSDQLDGGAGDDLLDADRELPGTTGRLGKGNDVLRGGAGDDTMNGGRGRDILIGGADDDILDGGIGNDTMTGGDGSDTFVFSRGNDLAKDFDVNEDVLDVSGRSGGISVADEDELLRIASGGTGVNGTSRLTKDGSVLTLTKVGLNFIDDIEVIYAG